MKKTAAMIAGLVFISMLWALSATAQQEAAAPGEQKAEQPAETQAASGPMEKANQLLDTKDMGNLKKAIGIYENILENKPDNFGAAWRCAFACREYALQAQHQQVEDWKDICAEYGEKGMGYAQKAMDLKPDKPHGYFFYGLSVGVYSDGVGLVTALKEGLKDKTQKNLEKAYEIDKTFQNGGPMLALGRFWQKVPWPYHDEDKAMQYYRELQDSPYFGKKVERYIFPAEILADKWGDEPKKEARQLLQKALETTDDPYWEQHARKLLEDL